MTGVVAIMAGMRGGPSMQVTASVVFASATGFGPSGVVSSNSSIEPNTTVVGGVSPYTYSWVRLSGDTPTISSATAQNPQWSATVADGATNFSSWQVTVTDAVSSTASTSITVTFIFHNVV